MPDPLDYATNKEVKRLKELDAIRSVAREANREHRKIMDRLYKRMKAREG
tara:strand:+ start:418 stop:567 length:150 start_codon:yes stop_codon:yes gene_type:complete